MKWEVIGCAVAFLFFLLGGIPVDRARQRAAAEDAERDAASSQVTSKEL